MEDTLWRKFLDEALGETLRRRIVDLVVTHQEEGAEESIVDILLEELHKSKQG